MISWPTRSGKGQPTNISESFPHDYHVPKTVDTIRAEVPRFQKPGSCGAEERRITCRAFVLTPSENVSRARKTKDRKVSFLCAEAIVGHLSVRLAVDRCQMWDWQRGRGDEMQRATP